MKALVIDFDRQKKIQAIKGLRAVGRDRDLKATRDFIEGPLPAVWECGSTLTWEGVKRTLEEHGVVAHCADDNAGLLQFLGALPGDMTVGHVRVTLNALRGFTLPGPPDG